MFPALVLLSVGKVIPARRAVVAGRRTGVALAAKVTGTVLPDAAAGLVHHSGTLLHDVESVLDRSGVLALVIDRDLVYHLQSRIALAPQLMMASSMLAIQRRDSRQRYQV